MNSHSDPGVSQRLPYRCAGCGTSLVTPPSAKPGDLAACCPCSDQIARNPGVLDLMHEAHDRGITLAELVALVQERMAQQGTRDAVRRATGRR